MTFPLAVTWSKNNKGVKCKGNRKWNLGTSSQSYSEEQVILNSKELRQLKTINNSASTSFVLIFLCVGVCVCLCVRLSGWVPSIMNRN